MPSQRPLPTLGELLDLAGKATRALGDIRNDTREGNVLELMYGPLAIVLIREVARDRDMFRAAYFAMAKDEDLTSYVSDHFGINDRSLDTRGVGKATLRRSSGAAGGGIFWKGTRLFFSPIGQTKIVLYEVTADTPVTGSTVDAIVPIRALELGPASKTDTTTSVTLLDPVWDPLWIVKQLTCSAGSLYEQNDAFRGRVRQTLRDRRVGYVASMKEALRAIGVTDAVFFDSDYAGITYSTGVNVGYVADATGSANDALVRKAQMKLEGFRVLGADMMVRPMTPTPLAITASVDLSVDPSTIDIVDLDTQARGRIKQFLQDVYVFKKNGLRGAIQSAGPVLEVTLTLPASDATLSPLAWPATLPRYRYDASLTKLTYQKAA